MKIIRLLGTITAGLAISAGATAVSAHAAAVAAISNAVVLSSEAMIERTETGSDGVAHVILKQPKDVIIVPGDRVIFTLKYVNKGAEPANGFRAINPMPGPIQFLSAAEDWAEVSVDGGRSWGKLEQLKVATKVEGQAAPVMRGAGPEDVTHVRWIFTKAIAPGAEGSVSYRGVVK